MHGCVVLPDVEDNIMQFKVPRGNILAYWPHSHGIFVILYFNSKIINQRGSLWTTAPFLALHTVRRKPH
jgi:hypothetical protein